MRSFVLGLSLAVAGSITALPAVAESYTPQQLQMFLGAACPSATNLTVDSDSTIHWEINPQQDDPEAIMNCLVQAWARLEADGFPAGPPQTNKVEVLPNGMVSIGYK